MAFVKVASVGDLPSGGSKQVDLNGRKIALFNIDGRIHAIDDTCPHRGGPLSEGQVLAGEITCPWHGARFSLSSGANLSPPARSGVAVHKVQVQGDEIQVEI
jgi:nitrite reductase/ring-hydroxylating ferredoxin subunit